MSWIPVFSQPLHAAFLTFKKEMEIFRHRYGWKNTSQSSRRNKLQLVHVNMLAYKEFAVPDLLVSNKWVKNRTC